MKQKTKGTNAERELVHMFWEVGWAAIRVAGSGSSPHPSPDVLAGNAVRRVAIECKSIKDKQVYLGKDEVQQLQYFAGLFGAEPWVGVRFGKGKWFFLTPEDLHM
ncbi:hypothetical protein COY95_01235, partial [Candidatus Woesearchaeota archaeon CG_4_10_14_0_8_um_filter_47_5]